LLVSDRRDHGPFDIRHKLVGPRQSYAAPAGELAPQNTAVPRICRTNQKVFALEIGKNSLHRLRRHESGARQARIRSPGVQFDCRVNGILRRGTPKRTQRLIHAGAERVLRALDRVTETLRHRLRHAAA